MSAAPVGLPVGGGHAACGLLAMPDVLRWQSLGDDALRVHREYVLLLAEQLGSVLAQTRESPRTAHLSQKLETMPASSWMRLVTAPRVSFRLLWPARHDSPSTVEFLAAAVDVELARDQAPGDAEGSGAVAPVGSDARWSVLGDGWLDGGGHYVAGPRLADLAPIDVGSPHARAIDLEGITDEVGAARSPYDAAQVAALLAQLGRVKDAMEAVTPDVLRFVSAFTKALVLQPDPEAPTGFSTGSSAQYVGRSVFGNPHLEAVDDALLAEGLVHEAIHSYMYMSERLEPWVNDEGLYGPEHVTRSLWTQNPLPLRAYLQACFVWFGLLNFWARMLASDAIDQDRSRARLAQAARGFLSGDVLEQVKPFRAGIAPELLHVVEQMQADVAGALEAI